MFFNNTEIQFTIQKFDGYNYECFFKIENPSGFKEDTVYFSTSEIEIIDILKIIFLSGRIYLSKQTTANIVKILRNMNLVF